MSDHFEDEYAKHSTEHSEEDGEPWLVSYADMMTLLFGFFVLMYSFASAKIDETSEDWIKVKREVAAFFGQSNSAQEETDESVSKNSVRRSDVDGGSLSDVPVVPFESKFRYLATREDLLAEVSALLRSLFERGSVSNPGISDRQTVAEVKILKAMLDGIVAGTSAAAIGSGGSQSDSGGAGSSLVNETLREVANQGDGEDLSADPLSGDDLAGTGQEVSLILDSRNLLAGSGNDAVFSVSKLGSDILDQLADRLLSFKRPLHITIEARMRWKRPGRPVRRDRLQALSDTSRKAVSITESLQLKLEEKLAMAGLGPNPHIFSIAGVGYFAGRGQEADFDETIIFRVNILRTEGASKAAGGP